MILLRIVTALCALFGRGRSPAMFLNLLAPRSGYSVERGIAYGDLKRNRLDLYRPLKVEANAPGILFFYGGGFVAGRRSEYRIVGEAFSSLGFVSAVADYRIFPEAKYPNFLEDAAKAVVKFRALLAENGGDADCLFVAGHSAGAYISVMLAANPRFLEAEGGARSWFRGVIGIAGAYGRRPFQSAEISAIFGDDRSETKPISYVTGNEPPMLLLVGSDDGEAQVTATRELAARIRSSGGAVEEIHYPGIGHGGIILALAPRFRGRASVRADIARFVRERSNKNPPPERGRPGA